jgi:ATP-dependent Lon protease
MFIATANARNIPGPLRDRMEVIELPGYTEEEKVRSRGATWLRARRANGFKPGQVALDEEALRHIIQDYTREAGVRTWSARSGR